MKNGKVISLEEIRAQRKRANAHRDLATLIHDLASFEDAELEFFMAMGVMAAVEIERRDLERRDAVDRKEP